MYPNTQSIGHRSTTVEFAVEFEIKQANHANPTAKRLDHAQYALEFEQGIVKQTETRSPRITLQLIPSANGAKTFQGNFLIKPK